MIRILHVLNSLEMSGAEVMLRIAASRFRDMGIRSDILSTGDTSAGPYATELEQAGYKIHHLSFRRRPRFFWSLRELVKRERFDVVHLHAERASIYMAMAVYGHAHIVRTIHSNFAFTGWLGHRRRITRMLTRLLGVRQLAISPSVQETERTYLGNETTVCLNWYDESRFSAPTDDERVKARAVYNLAETDIALVSVGNCNEVKNHIAVIDALRKVDAPKIVYLHAGLEDESKTERSVATGFGLSGTIRFLGPVADVPALLSAADIFVMPSLYEGLSIALLEALACGVPGLLSNVVGLRDMARWFPNIVYFNLTADDLADKLQAMAAMAPEARRGLAKSYPGVARETFSAQAGARRYADVYFAMTGKQVPDR